VRQPYARVDYIPPVRDEEFGSREWYVCDPRITVADKIKKNSGGNSLNLLTHTLSSESKTLIKRVHSDKY
jgi:hypothetical protein